MIFKNRGDQRALFKITNNLLDKTNSRGVLPNYENPTVLANKFNNYYINKVAMLRDAIPVSSSNVYNNLSDFSGIVMTSFRLTSIQEIGDILKKSVTLFQQKY